MKKILIVDDDLALRGMLALTLDQAGYSVFEASSANEAMQILRGECIELMLLDMGMPPNEHSPDEGIRVLDWVAQSGLNLKTIVLTGQESDATSYKAIKHGAFDFLSKPISNQSLLNSIERAILFLKQTQKLKAEEGIQKVALDLAVGDGVKSARNAAELKLLTQVLQETEFNVHETSRRLGLKRENVYYLINKYGLERESF